MDTSIILYNELVPFPHSLFPQLPLVHSHPTVKPVIKVCLKAVFWTLFFLICLLLLTLVGIGIFGWIKLNEFTTAAETTPQALVELVQKGWNTSPKMITGQSTFLILGTDELANRPNTPVLTDTILLVSVKPETGMITTLPLPRDLWNIEYKTRINALYHYGKERYPEEPERFSREVIEQMTGLKIEYTVVVSIGDIQQLIDIIGGVDVVVSESFTDTAFPRSDVDVTVEKDPAKLYQTVSFTKGTEHMDGERALTYMRSRHAAGTQGSDFARSGRQQAVLSGILAKLKQKEFYFDMGRLGKLFAFYKQHFDHLFPITDGIGMSKLFWPKIKQAQLKNNVMSEFPGDKFGVITHPDPRLYKGEWILTVRNEQHFKEFVRGALGEE